MGAIECGLRLADGRDLSAAVHRCRRLLDLDADPHAIDEVLGADPVLGPLVASAPGRRSPGHVDGDELAVRAVLGQQVSVAGARTIAGRLARRVGTPLPEPDGGLTHAFPTAEQLVQMNPDDLPMPAARRRTLLHLSDELATGKLAIDPGEDRVELRAALLALPGIGPWTADYIAMRALGDPDVFLATDLGVRHAAARFGLDASPGALAALAERWRPWRSYAVHHLWTSLEGT
jgi:AraC family transcriptional regulator of adaptative response / DNA-3-methyladenine glycosylase II